MHGLQSTLNHIIPIIVIYILFCLVMWFVKSEVLKKADDNRRKQIISSYKDAVRWAGILCFIIIVAVLGFLSNPFEREYIRTINLSEPSESYEPPTIVEIDVINEEAENAKHIEKEEEAEQDNTNALNKSKELFN